MIQFLYSKLMELTELMELTDLMDHPTVTGLTG